MTEKADWPTELPVRAAQTIPVSGPCEHGLSQDDLQSALDELQREMMVRERCFPKWINEGKVSRSDAKDRLHRQSLAIKCVQFALDNFNDSGE